MSKTRVLSLLSRVSSQITGQIILNRSSGTKVISYTNSNSWIVNKNIASLYRFFHKIVVIKHQNTVNTKSTHLLKFAIPETATMMPLLCHSYNVFNQALHEIYYSLKEDTKSLSYDSLVGFLLVNCLNMRWPVYQMIYTYNLTVILLHVHVWGEKLQNVVNIFRWSLEQP